MSMNATTRPTLGIAVFRYRFRKISDVLKATLEIEEKGFRCQSFHCPKGAVAPVQVMGWKVYGVTQFDDFEDGHGSQRRSPLRKSTSSSRFFSRL
jgi:hypothetical protein